jgi:hypothetical protein
MNIWNLKLMEQEIGPYEFYSECLFYTFNWTSVFLKYTTIYVSRITVLGTDIVPENVEWAESLIWKEVHCSHQQENEVRNNAFQMEMTGTVRIFTRLNHSSSVLENRFCCALKQE